LLISWYQLIENIGAEFDKIRRKHNLAAGDFPDVADFQIRLRDADFSTFKRLKEKLIHHAEEALREDIPRMFAALPKPVDNEGDDIMLGEQVPRAATGKPKERKEQYKVA
jgi:hypothetical protein